MIESMAAYLDLAKEATDTKTDSNLARKIGVTRTYIGQMRHGTRLPSEQTMLALANRANLDPKEALILLNLWKAEGEAKEIYTGLLQSHLKAIKKFGVTSALVLFMLSPTARIGGQTIDNAQNLKHTYTKTHSHNAPNIKHYAIYSHPITTPP